MCVCTCVCVSLGMYVSEPWDVSVVCVCEPWDVCE